MPVNKVRAPHVIRDVATTTPTFEDFHRDRRRHALLYARSILGADRAEDACQEAWIKAWKAWGTARADRLDAWLFRIVRNCSIDRLRADRSEPGLEESDLPPIEPFEDDVLSAVDAGVVGEMLASLSAPLREVLWLREVMDLTYSEIAQVQDVPVGTVMSRLHSARSKAARYLQSKGVW